MEPKVTFIIAHHKYEQYLPKAIESAFSQTYKNIHVCVIDDCTDDGSVIGDTPLKQAMAPYLVDATEVVTKNNMQITHCPDLTFIQLIKPDGGSYKQGYARNRGIEVCWDDTDVFAILDADDENYPTKIERCVEVLQSDPKIGAVYTDTNIVVTETGRLVREYREPYDYFRLMQECIVHSGCVIKKEALESVLENGKVFDESLPPCEDYDLWVRLAERYLFYHIPEPLVYVRVHPQNSTVTSTHEHRMEKIQRIFDKRRQRLQ